MKEVPNKTIAAVKNDKGLPSTLVDLLALVIDVPPQRTGWTPTVIRARNRVADAIAELKPGDVIKLEDADYATARTAVEECPLTLPRKVVTEMYDAFGL